MWLFWSVSKFSVFALLFSLFRDQHHTALIIETVMVSHKGLSLPGSPCTLHSDRDQFNRPIQPLVRHPSGPLLPSTWATSNQRPVNNLLLPLVRPLRVPSPSLLYIKGPWMLSEMRGFLETLDCHPLGLLAFWLKSSFLAPNNSYPDLLACCAVSRTAWAWQQTWHSFVGILELLCCFIHSN